MRKLWGCLTNFLVGCALELKHQLDDWPLNLKPLQQPGKVFGWFGWLVGLDWLSWMVWLGFWIDLGLG